MGLLYAAGRVKNIFFKINYKYLKRLRKMKDGLHPENRAVIFKDVSCDFWKIKMEPLSFRTRFEQE